MKVDVASTIENSELAPLHYVVLGAGFVIMMIDGYDIASMGMVVPALSKDWGAQPADFSIALSAALVGVLFGSGIAGYLGDRIGRKSAVCAMLAASSIGMLATPFATSFTELAIARFIAGFGAGGCIPVVLTYTQEFMPAKVRNFLTTLMYTGAGMGSVVAGFLGAKLIVFGGWEAVFVLGGILPAATTVFVLTVMPESPRYLAGKGVGGSEVGLLLERIDRSFVHSPRYRYSVAQNNKDLGEDVGETNSYKIILGNRYLRMTLIIWLLFFANQFLVFFSGTWLPTLITGVGYELESALYVVALFNVGGISGGVLLGAIGDRFAPTRVLVVGYAGAAVFMVLLGFVYQAPNLFMVVALLAGAGVLGSSFLLGVATTGLYPTGIRASGIGSALAIGRFGAISSPLLGGWLLSKGAGLTTMMLVCAIPATLAVACVVLLNTLLSKQARSGSL